MTLHDLIEGLAEVLIAGVGSLVAVAALFIVLASISDLVSKARQRLCRRRRSELERYCAEQTLHRIRRKAIRDMLETSGSQPDAYRGDVIEGTAVEVSR